jgi:thioredoxin 1
LKQILMFIIASCPYCKKAMGYVEELMKEKPEYKNIPFRIIDETVETEFAESYDYYYVPAFYADNEKVHEGEAAKDDVRKVFEQAEEE